MRVAFWTSSYSPELHEALRRRGCEIVVLLGGYDEQIPSYSTFDLFFGKGFEEIDAATEPPVPTGKGVLDEYMRCAGRIGFNPFTHENNFRSGGVVHPDTVTDWFQLHARIALHLLDRFRPDQLWMANHPHMGFDNALLAAALHRGLEVIDCNPLPIPEKFRFRKYGPDGRECHPIEPFRRLSLEGFQPNLFYLRGVQRDASMGPVRRALRSLRVALHQKSIRALLTAAYDSSVRRRSVVVPSLLELLDRHQRGASLIRFQRRISARALRKTARKTVDWRMLSQPFVYFPLHLEPEAAISAVGNGFHNQVNAIQALRAVLPVDWTILLKENPKQAQLHRDLAFYQRLASMPGVAFVDDDCDSSELIDAAALVATITGTAGFEALRAGKACIHFGDPWYATLPGAIEFDRALDFAELADTTIDQRALDEALCALSESFADGLVNDWMTEILPADTSWTALMDMTADSLMRIARA